MSEQEETALEPPDSTCEVCGHQVPRLEWVTEYQLLVCANCKLLIKLSERKQRLTKRVS